jgi:hypothetical protein
MVTHQTAPAPSPAGTQLSIDGDSGVTVDLQADNQSRSPGVAAWSLDGRAVLSYGDVLASDGATPRIHVHGVAFAGSSESVLAQQDDKLQLVDTRQPSAPRTLAEHVQLRAQSAEQSTIVISSDYGRKLAMLRAPSWQAVGAPLLTNGIQGAAFSANGDRLALLDENNQLEVRLISKSGVGEVIGRYSLPPAPRVSALLFDPSGRFLVLEGTPLRFLRLSDGQILNLYVGSLDHLDRLEAPLLFVNQQGEMEGNATLASELYCDSAADTDWSGTRPLCELPHFAPGLVERFFLGG